MELIERAGVTIRDRQWLVDIADTPWKLTQGLSDIPEISLGTGMLFDVGWVHHITVTTARMMFPLDVAFISESLVIADIRRGLTPGEIVTSDTPARYFLEVNAGELSGIGLGDHVSIELIAQEETPNLVSNWVNMAILVVSLAVAGTFAVSVARGRI
ncbi:MAG TPA: DUF192 domain-containing protein [Dehalococcoidia bacterium]|nr:DUF192 domain-containing protein [Dehalococcoidia bacterium]